MRYWNLHTPEKPHTFYHDGPVTGIVWLSTSCIASTGSDGTLRVHDLSSGLCTVKLGFHGRTEAISRSQDGELLLFGDRRSIFALPVNGLTSSTPPVFKVPHSQDSVNSIALSRDRSRLYASGTQKVAAWHMEPPGRAFPQRFSLE